MSRLEEVKDQLVQQFHNISEKIQETEIYNQLNDKYQSLTPQGQKMTRFAVAAVALSILLYSPVSQIQLSQDFVLQFEEKRELIRDLFKTYRSASAQAQLAPAPSSSELIGNIQSQLTAARLIPEQIISVNVSAAEGRLIPQNLLSDVVEVKLTKLNLRQIVDIGTQLTNISQAVKVKDLIIQATQDMGGYFDVSYKLYSLKVPTALPEPPPDMPEPKKKKKSNTEESEE